MGLKTTAELKRLFNEIEKEGTTRNLKKHFIVLPNPMYGDWEGAIYNYNFRLTDAEKAAKRKGALKAY